jgi:hypothetical protein
MRKSTMMALLAATSLAIESPAAFAQGEGGATGAGGGAGGSGSHAGMGESAGTGEASIGVGTVTEQNEQFDPRLSPFYRK